ncbi:helix-turn-helix domain-containing protein [Larkinella rosea]|uniref:Transcriptional regulator n=1 Tax=Larkinella rosea TaxID=2025312 RepID=A0A3P1BT54_9BACT|nr:transcriptional regulator [Larkinella rosea]RRB04089.1 transcriptional regulator [Larkinella rosea]
MNWKIIKNEEQYEEALQRADEIFDAKSETAEGDELELLVMLIKEYENRIHPVLPPDPVEAIKLTMAEQGLQAKDLVSMIGSKGYISQLLNRKKPLTAEILRTLHKQLGIPAEILLS